MPRRAPDPAVAGVAERRRLEGYLGGQLDDPRTVAELAAALQAVRTFPTHGAPAAEPSPTDS